MNSSGIKRGLATTAVSALAIAGLPLFASSASARPLAEEPAAGEVDLFTPAAIASVKNDGTDGTVHLVANAADDVQQVRFQYNLDPAATNATADWVDIATVSRAGSGEFSTDWAPAPALFNTDVAIRALGLAAGEVVTDDAEINTNVTVSPSAESVDIAYAPGAQVGVFDQPYAADAGRVVTSEDLLGAVSGTTSDLAGDPGLTFASAYGTGGTTNEDVAGEVATGASSRTYSAPVEFNGYDFGTATDADQAVIIATADGDDAEAVALYEQTVTSVTAAADNATVIPTGTTDIVVTVLDQNNNPVVGAEVVSEDTAETKFTNSQGEATFTGVGGAPAPGATYDFYVNTTVEYDYENGTDFRRSVTVTEVAQTPTTLDATSADGPAFDVDEYAAGDIEVVLTDQNGDGIENRVVNYTWTFQGFTVGGVTPPPVTTPGTTAPTNADGEATVPLPAGYAAQSGTYVLDYYLNQDGTPGQGAGDLSGETLTVKGGDSTLEFDAPQPAVAGGNGSFSADLTLADGTPLVGRDVQFALTQNTTDLVVAPQADQPAGTTRISPTVAEDTTDANGAVQVTVFDPANPTPRSELTATLDADTINTPDIGNANEDAADITLQFVTDEVDGTPTVTVTGPAGTGTPGIESATGTVEVTVDDPDTAPVETVAAEDLLVTLTVDGDAFFTDGTYEDHEADDEAGNLTSLGQTITVITDNAGEATYNLGIGRSEDFDDDGEATVVVTAAVAEDTDSDEAEFSSENPLNGGEVFIDFADEQFQESGILPLAPTTDNVAYDVQVTDQFGNLVGGETVDIDSDFGTPSAATIQTDFVDNAEFTLMSGSAGDATPTASWDAPTNLFNADSPNDAYTDRSALTDDLEADGPTAQFYAVDFANSTFTLAQQGPEVVPVGTTVIMDYTAIDQNGEPIEFSVDFFRTGPDDFQDGDPNNPMPIATGQDGTATYVFSGAAAGTATVTGVGYLNGAVVPASQANDTVEFGGNIAGDPIDILISGDDNGAKKDVVRTLVTNGDAETIRLYKIRGTKAKGNKRLVEVREAVVPEGGNMTFKVRDANGSRKTRFVAKIRSGGETFKSNTQKLR